MDDAEWKATTIYLPEDLHKALRIEAIKEGISMTELARRVLEDYLRKAGHRLKRHAAPTRGRGNTRQK
jgi:plasmid stability protein